MRFTALFALLICSLAPGTGAASNPLHIELVTEVRSVQPGRPFYVGLHIVHPAGYHTYWKFPGIVGIPTDIRWDLPEGWKAGPIEWPAPERVHMYEIKAQGFHGERLLPVKVTPPAGLRPDQSVTLKGSATWMCCGRDCNPGFADLRIDLPVTAEATKPDRRWIPLFAASRQDIAKPCTDWSTEARRSGDAIVLRIKPASAAAQEHFDRIKEITFFTENGLIDPNKPDSLRKTGDAFVLTQTISEHAPKPMPTRLTGILETPQGWLPDGKPRSIHITQPIR